MDICISHLPNEIISMILLNNDCRDIINFASTCKLFNEMVNNDQSLWKAKFKSTLPKGTIKIFEQRGDGDWLRELKTFFTVKQQLKNEILAMSPLYYWRNSDVGLEDLRNFFTIALTNSMSFYYTIEILQEIIKECKKHIDEFRGEKPYTLTAMHYAQVALCNLIHTFLAIKWAKGHARNDLTPKAVINFFLQWVDTDHIHSDEDVDNKIMELVKKVEIVLENNHATQSNTESIREKCTKGLISERQVLSAVTEVIYHQWRMAVTSVANLDGINIVKVIDNKCGNVIVVSAIYQEVAKAFGVNCKLVAFPNHLFLEWRDNSGGRGPNVYSIDLGTGKLHAKRQCPFAGNSQSNQYKYYPDSLLQYIYTSFQTSMGAFQNWNTINAKLLLDFLGTYDIQYTPYSHFLPYLLDRAQLPEYAPLNWRFLSDEYLEIINTLSSFNSAFKTMNRNIIIKKRDTRVKFAVGMICYHRRYDYVCVIRGWDYNCTVEGDRRVEIERLEFGPRQPFYHVIAADQSERYVAQENLTEISRPNRLYHLEYLIAREFTHFDGFAYIPNEEKISEYPDDVPVLDLYRSRCELKSFMNIA